MQGIAELGLTETMKAGDLVSQLGITEVWLRSELARGQRIQGPAIICEQVATTLLTKNWTGYLDDWGNLRLTYMGGA